VFGGQRAQSGRSHQGVDIRPRFEFEFEFELS
jgi:hypothetical protein